MKNWNEFKPSEFTYKSKWIYNWFSNMLPCLLHIDGESWPSVENYYQAQKTVDPDVKSKFLSINAKHSKALGRSVNLREDWEDIKEEEMRIALEYKFRIPYWANRLDETGEDILIEWNNWGDQEWGVDYITGYGHNKLGLLLMDIRSHNRRMTKVNTHTVVQKRIDSLQERVDKYKSFLLTNPVEDITIECPKCKTLNFDFDSEALDRICKYCEHIIVF